MRRFGYRQMSGSLVAKYRFGWLSQRHRHHLSPISKMVEEISNADSGHKSFGAMPSVRIDENQLLPSERKALEVLTAEGWSILKKLLSDAPPTKSKDVLRVSVRLARVIWYVSQAETITVKFFRT